ncbi:ABC transporter ATP-binding protein [Candidatus Peregrinibacteria bacterium]|nr:ABC transporter ATP-binding protein [Candidatus Peregrinibacteria bacterium]
MKTAIEIKGLHKVYKGGTHALKGVDLEIKEGEFFALLGPNGSGKTTLISTMSGSVKKTEGNIKIFGKSIDEQRELTKMMIGVVPQEVHFDSFFNVNEVLNLQSGYYGIKNNQKWIDEILEKLNLHTKKFANTRALSGGMKRRLLVAKALVHKPKMIVLDEPTAGVDVELRHNLWTYIRKLNEDGLTILLTTHYLEEAETLCERTAILDQGELIKIDKTKNLIESMGDQKYLTIHFKEKNKGMPASLKKFDPKKVNEHSLSIKFAKADLQEALKAIEELPQEIIDIDMKSQTLEDVFLKLTNLKR